MIVFEEIMTVERDDVDDICKILKYGSDKITHMKMKVDRGVTDFGFLGDLLVNFYPKLSNLRIEQNYSYREDFEADEFYNFIEMVKLDHFELDDCQSKFLENLDIDRLFNVMKNNSTCLIVFRTNYPIKLKESVKSEKIISKNLYNEELVSDIYKKDDKKIICRYGDLNSEDSTLLNEKLPIIVIPTLDNVEWTDNDTINLSKLYY